MTSQSNNIPKISTWKLLPQLPKILRQRTQVFLKFHQKHGDVVRLEYKFPRTLFFHPDAVRHILKDNQKNYVKGRTYEAMHPFFGQGVLTSEGELWQKQRRLFAPEFHAQTLKKYFQTFQDCTQVMLKDWTENPKEKYNVADEMMELTLKMVGSTLLGSDVSEDVRQIGEAVNLGLHEIVERTMGVFRLPRWVPTLGQIRLKKSMRRLDSIIHSIIQKRRKQTLEQSDLITKILSIKDQELAFLQSDSQLRDQVVTFLVAGHETTANALAWTLYLLSLHPEVIEILKQEIESVLPNRCLEFEDIPKLVYLKQVIQESMRVYPPVPTIPRVTVESDEVCGVKLPADSWVVMSPYVTHRHPEFWTEPEKFLPERFEASRIASQHPFAYFPFGGGPRKCIGEHFAMLEAQVVIVGILQHFNLQLLSSPKVEEEALVTLRPKNGLWMKVKKI